jgi:hypothetical protein
MGQRELRRVPKDWAHPRMANGHYLPLFNEPYERAIEKWIAARDNFAKGLDEDGMPLSEEAKGCTFEDWHGSEPQPDEYRPNWPEETMTHFQMYETCSEGTPISPVLESPEAVARWCADNRASAFGDNVAPYEWWLRVCQGTAGFGLMVDTATGEQRPI